MRERYDATRRGRRAGGRAGGVRASCRRRRARSLSWSLFSRRVRGFTAAARLTSSRAPARARTMSAPDPAAPTFDPNEQLASVLLSNVRHVNTRIALSKTNRAFREAYKNHTAEELPPSLDFSGYDNPQLYPLAPWETVAFTPYTDSRAALVYLLNIPGFLTMEMDVPPSAEQRRLQRYKTTPDRFHTLLSCVGGWGVGYIPWTCLADICACPRRRRFWYFGMARAEPPIEVHLKVTKSHIEVQWHTWDIGGKPPNTIIEIKPARR